MSNISDNNSKIDKAFRLLTQSKDAAIAAGFVKMMQFGLEALLEAHSSRMSHATEERETLGWAIFHDGVEIASGAQDRGDIEGSVLLQLEFLGSSTKGWVGFLMSDMEYDWYRVDYEESFLIYAKDKIKANFDTFFKPIRP